MVFVSKTPSKKFHSNLTNEKLTGFLSLFPNSLTLHLRRLLFVRYIYIVVCFLFLVFNLSIGANGCASKRQWVYEWTLKTLSNCALLRAGLFEGLYHGIFVEDFPTLMSFLIPSPHNLQFDKQTQFTCTLNTETQFTCTWTLKTKLIACGQKSQIIHYSVIHFLKNERASKVCTMKSLRKSDFPIFKTFTSNVEIKGLRGPR